MNNQMAEKKRKSLWDYVKELGSFERIMVVAVIGFIFYTNQSSVLVPNYNNETNSYLYTKETLYVPKSNITNSQTFFEVLLFITCIFFLLQKRVGILKRATPKEAMDDISLQLKEVKNIPLADGNTIALNDSTEINISPIFITRYMETGDERKEFRYVFQCILTDHNLDTKHFFRAWYEPWNRHWDGFYESDTPLRQKDRCPDCGNEWDVKYLKSDDLRKIWELRKGTSMTPPIR